MLKMKKKCESCEQPTDQKSLAFICSYECTFCATCTEEKHQHICPNCQGELIRRPTRIISPAKVVAKQLQKKITSTFSS